MHILPLSKIDGIIYVLPRANPKHGSVHCLGGLWSNHEVAENSSIFLQLTDQPLESFIEVRALLVLARGRYESILCILDL